MERYRAPKERRAPASLNSRPLGSSPAFIEEAALTQKVQYRLRYQAICRLLRGDDFSCPLHRRGKNGATTIRPGARDHSGKGMDLTGMVDH